jgi:hypothetical protein
LGTKKQWQGFWISYLHITSKFLQHYVNRCIKRQCKNCIKFPVSQQARMLDSYFMWNIYFRFIFYMEQHLLNVLAETISYNSIVTLVCFLISPHVSVRSVLQSSLFAHQTHWEFSNLFITNNDLMNNHWQFTYHCYVVLCTVVNGSCLKECHIFLNNLQVH